MDKEPRYPNNTGQDIYDTARELQVKKMKGETVTLSTETAVSIRQSLQTARSGVSQMGLEPGYERARWLMIATTLLSEEVSVTEEDIAAIQEAAAVYIAKRNFYQLASLIQTAEVVGISINLDSISESDQKEIDENLTKMQ